MRKEKGEAVLESVGHDLDAGLVIALEDRVIVKVLLQT